MMKRWVPELLAAVNGDAAPFGFALTPAGRAQVTELLDAVLGLAKGQPLPWRDLPAHWMPRVGVSVVRGVRVVNVEQPPSTTKTPIPTSQPPSPPGYEDTLCGVAAGLLVHPIGARLRRCDWADCGAFFLARSNHRRPHSFCSDKHRRAYDVAHRDPKRVAEYMREYRRVARKRKRKRRT